MFDVKSPLNVSVSIILFCIPDLLNLMLENLTLFSRNSSHYKVSSPQPIHKFVVFIMQC